MSITTRELGELRELDALREENEGTWDDRTDAIRGRFDDAEDRRRGERYRPAIRRVAAMLNRINRGQ